MKKIILLLLAVFLLSSCSVQEEEKIEIQEATPQVEEEIVENLNIQVENGEGEAIILSDEEFFLINTPPTVESLKEDGSITLKNEETFNIKIEKLKLYGFGETICQNENEFRILGSNSKTLLFEDCILKEGELYSVIVQTTSDNYSITAQVE